MSVPETTAATREPGLAREWLRALRYHLGGRRGLLALAGFAAVFGISANWSWLVAAGIAPLLIGVLPCVAMCALGLRMNRAMGGSCAGKKGAADVAATPGARPEALPPAAAADPNRLTLALDDVDTPVRPAVVAPAAPGDVARTQTTEEEKIHA